MILRLRFLLLLLFLLLPPVLHCNPMPPRPSDMPDFLHSATARAGPLGNASYCSAVPKAQKSCGQQRIKALLVTGVGRSGTHHTQQSLQQKGVAVGHESVLEDGAVAWTFAVVDAENRYPWQAPKHSIRPDDRFATIVHQVRHPLKVIASLATFHNASWRWIARHTPSIPGLANMKPLRRSLIHWVTWNRWIETFADLRYNIEAKLPLAKCERHVVFVRKMARRHSPVTWRDLYEADPHFAHAAYEMAIRYGYGDTPPEK